MNLKALRRSDEKVLTAIAVIFSSLVWIGLAAAVVYPFTVTVPPIEPCVYLDEDGEYDYESMKDARYYYYTDDCLPKAEVPAETYEEAVKVLTAEAQYAKRGESALFLGVLFYVGLIFGFIYFSIALTMAFIRLNGVKLGEKQYAAFYKIYEKTAAELGLKSVPDAYIIHAGGELNAFAIKIARRKMVVFFAELIENLVEGNKFDELHAVAAHELTHVKLRHINYWFFLLPFNSLPLLGARLSRARELSADRGALFICKRKEVVAQALLKLVTGKMVAQHVDVNAYVENGLRENGFFATLARLLASHPPIPSRIAIIEAEAEKP